jgi:hypothetical protein
MCGHHASIAVNVYETAAAPPGPSKSLPDHAESSVACELKSAACKMLAVCDFQHSQGRNMNVNRDVLSSSLCFESQHEIEKVYEFLFTVCE